MQIETEHKQSGKGRCTRVQKVRQNTSDVAAGSERSRDRRLKNRIFFEPAKVLLAVAAHLAVN